MGDSLRISDAVTLGQPVSWFFCHFSMVSHTRIISPSNYHQNVTSLTNWPGGDLNPDPMVWTLTFYPLSHRLRFGNVWISYAQKCSCDFPSDFLMSKYFLYQWFIFSKSIKFFKHCLLGILPHPLSTCKNCLTHHLGLCAL